MTSSHMPASLQRSSNRTHFDVRQMLACVDLVRGKLAISRTSRMRDEIRFSPRVANINSVISGFGGRGFALGCICERKGRRGKLADSNQGPAWGRKTSSNFDEMRAKSLFGGRNCTRNRGSPDLHDISSSCEYDGGATDADADTVNFARVKVSPGVLDIGALTRICLRRGADRG